jgi:flagellar biosynthesis protein FliQ
VLSRLGDVIFERVGRVAFLIVLGAMLAALLGSIYGAVLIGALINAVIGIALPALEPIEGLVTLVALIGGLLIGPWMMLRLLRWSRRRADAIGFEWSTDAGHRRRAAVRGRSPSLPPRLDPHTIAELDTRLAPPSAGRQGAPEEPDR